MKGHEIIGCRPCGRVSSWSGITSRSGSILDSLSGRREWVWLGLSMDLNSSTPLPKVDLRVSWIARPTALWYSSKLYDTLSVWRGTHRFVGNGTSTRRIQVFPNVGDIVVWCLRTRNKITRATSIVRIGSKRDEAIRRDLECRVLIVEKTEAESDVQLTGNRIITKGDRSASTGGVRVIRERLIHRIGSSARQYQDRYAVLQSGWIEISTAIHTRTQDGS